MRKISFKEKLKQSLKVVKEDLKQAVKVKVVEHKRKTIEERTFKRILAKKLAAERRRAIEKQARIRVREKVKAKFQPSKQRIADKQKVNKEFMDTFNSL